MVIVDDEPFIIEGLKRLADWEDYGVEITAHAFNGSAALDIIKKSPVDILVTDLKMPKMDGLELIRNVRKLDLDIRVIVLSGYNDFEYVKESLKYGIENYILKPVNEDELISTVKNTIAKIDDNINKLRMYQNNITLLRENVLYRWVSGGISSDELVQRSGFLGIDLGGSEYMVAVLRILSEQDPHEITFDRALSSDEVRGIGSRTLGRIKNNAMFYGLKKDIVFIFYGSHGAIDGIDTEKIKEAARGCIAKINAELDVDCFITLGNVAGSYKDVSRSYEAALETQEYFLIFKQNNVIDSREIAARQQSFQHSDVKIDFAAFKNLVLSHKTEELSSFIDALYGELSGIEGMTPNYLQNTAMELLFYIINFLKTIRIDTDHLYSDMKKINISRINTIKELTDSIKNICASIIELLSLKENRTSPLINGVLSHISNNYAGEISLKTLSQIFNCNANYLGQVFKTEIGEFFTDFLNRFRIEKACGLLAGEHLKASEVSGMVGYIDQNYFYKAFKKYTGISPSEYKNYIKSGIAPPAKAGAR
jgi:two-component system response regulator YesN